MTSPETEQALLLDTTAFWHMKKTEHDVDKLRAALPKEVQNALMLLDRLDTVTADLIYAITVHLNKEKEAGRSWPSRATRDQARECIKAAKELLHNINLAQTVGTHGERLATTLDNNFYKALGMIEPGCVSLLMKTEPDVDKVLAALPEIDQKVVAGLKDCDQFEPALVYAIKAIVDKQKETRNFCAGWSAAQERAKAAKKILDKINDDKTFCAKFKATIAARDEERAAAKAELAVQLKAKDDKLKLKDELLASKENELALCKALLKVKDDLLKSKDEQLKLSMELVASKDELAKAKQASKGQPLACVTNA